MREETIRISSKEDFAKYTRTIEQGNGDEKIILAKVYYDDNGEIIPSMTYTPSYINKLKEQEKSADSYSREEYKPKKKKGCISRIFNALFWIIVIVAVLVALAKFGIIPQN